MNPAQKLASRAKLAVERARAHYAPVDVTVRVFKRFGEDDGGSYAAALTYYTFFSIFPLLLFSASLLGFLTQGHPDVRESLIREGVKTIPLLRDALTPDGITFIVQNRGSLALTGGLLALYAGSGVVVALEHALNRFHGITDEPNWIQKRLRSLKWLLVLGLGAVITIGLGGLAGFSEAIFGHSDTLAPVMGVVGFVAGVFVNVLIFATAYKFLPAAKQTWREVLPGSIVAAIAFAVLQVAGTAYLARGSQARNETFGTFAGAAALLVASYLLSQIMLLAAEVNLVLQERKRIRKSSLAYGKGEGMSEIPTTDTPYKGNGLGNGQKDKSAGQLMKEVTEDLSTLIRKEIELAKQELGESVSAKAKGAVIIAVAGAIGFFALIFMLLAIRDGFDTFFVTWFADILTAVVLVAIAGLAAWFASKKLKTPISTEMTKKTIKEDVEWAKTLGRR